MPRSLPWLANDNRQDTRQRDGTPTPRARRRSPHTPTRNTEINGNQVSAPWETPRHLDVLRSSRSPPTSPVYAPPIEEYIREGFDNDDMYIMVEDEFYAVAQLFTRHLHQAEYVRRRKEAKEQNASVIRNLSRPTDGKTAMSKEALKRKESENIHELQRQALATPRRPRTDSDDVEETGGSDLEEDRDDDPWYGTSLHTLMTSPRKNRSLVGLDGIRSHTRAAAGYRPEVARQRSDTYRPTQTTSREEPAVDPVAMSSSDEDDDLEIIESRSSRPNHLPQSSLRTRPSIIKGWSQEASIDPSIRQHTAMNKDHMRPSLSESARSATSDQPPTLSKKSHIQEVYSSNDSTSTSPRTSCGMNFTKPRKRILLDDIDGSIEVKEEVREQKFSIHNIIQGQPRRSLSNASSHSRHRAEDNSGKKSRLNNVPTFLV
ncbi:hypothetical protein BGW36DRAFT_428518 [Talaromyces proteolyticus]|uniref:Uncharacterized protein n=1 Tax=Talaromyces proteolyticus TaxID=1131652 RepID=A0AAD4KQ73_9EURO|nr:uncharacterized protein BGW36DRAFT_428518 [Talaromyces proteolyticus]KAH8696513.1 hypothetical protein BGW36DRAFT_428518 [Talaromyces proteolyticus]